MMVLSKKDRDTTHYVAFLFLVATVTGLVVGTTTYLVNGGSVMTLAGLWPYALVAVYSWFVGVMMGG